MVNKGRLIGGLVFLALAALLAILAFALPSDQTMFMVNNTNMPWVPVVVLAVVGLGLLAGARQR